MEKIVEVCEVVKNKLIKNSNTYYVKSKLGLLFFSLSIIYMELVFKIAVFQDAWNIGLLYMALFSIPIGLMLFIVSTSFNEKINRLVSISATIILTLIYIIQAVYYKIFSTFLALFSINGTGQVLQFWQEILIAIEKSILPIIFLLVPLLLLLRFRVNLLPAAKTSKVIKAVTVGVAILIQSFATALVASADSGELSTNFIYSKSIIPVLSVDRFGLLTTARLDLKHLFFGFNEEDIELAEEEFNNPGSEAHINDDQNQVSTSSDIGKSNAAVSEPAAATSKSVEYNTMQIDFDKLISEEKDAGVSVMHKYFKSLEPTKKNDYTGIFKGKNLILITAEGFSPYAINKELTPTLYKMSKEGFQFTNFYTPIWGISTSDGEYVACNSLVPKTGVWSFYLSGKNYMPFVMGNQLQKIGYSTRAYHNHTYTYYHREVSHPNMGYIFKAVGSGLDVKKTWPESDLEMIEKTTDEYIGDTPFHTYYMTVSGHLRYSFDGNSMSRKNKSLVEHLPYSDAVKAYLACNIEFEKAMAELIGRLEKAGIAEDTVIAISPDHYPYGLTIDEISELAGHKVESNFELYKGVFLLWSKGMKPVKVDKLCSSLDILPTISNLLGVEYDSRLVMGKDILSDASPLVVFSNWSWITDKASYNSKEKKLTLAEGETNQTVNKEYTGMISKKVSNMFKYSTKILETDYYDKVFKGNEK